jgi:ketosteroid isomerase-like protein
MTVDGAQTIADHAIVCLRAADYAALTERYAPDAVLDVNLPMWRFQLQGPAASRQYFTEQMAPLSNLNCTQLRELIAGNSVSVESECRFDGPDGAGLWRCIDVLRIVGDEIVEHTQYCTGCWSPADIVRQSAEAPMVRW